MTQAPRWTGYVPLEQLRPALINAKAHDHEGIGASVTEHGFADSPIVDERTGRLVAGHGRVATLVGMFERGEPMPDGLLLDDDGLGWLVPVQRGWSSPDDAAASKLNIRHNKVGEDGGWNDRTLAEQLHELNAADPAALDDLNFTAERMDELLGLLNLDPADPDLPPPPSGADDSDLGPDTDPAPDTRPDNIVCPACGHFFPARP